MKIKQLLLPVIALCMAAASSHAATIIYTFGTDTAAINGNSTGQTATQAASTNTFAFGVTAGTYSATSTTGGIGVTGGEMRAIKKSDTDTHTFSITIPAGLNVNLTSLAFNYGTRGADTAPANFAVSSNRSGGTFTPNTSWTHAATANTSASASIALGGTFTNFDTASSTVITFTLADSAGGNNNSTAMYTWIDNVTLTGTAVPEPSAALLGGLGLLALLRRRRA